MFRPTALAYCKNPSNQFRFAGKFSQPRGATPMGDSPTSFLAGKVTETSCPGEKRSLQRDCRIVQAKRLELLLLFTVNSCFVTMRAPWHSEGSSRPTLGHVLAMLDVLDRLPSPRRAQKFPFKASCKMSLSNVKSPTTFFSRRFTSSSCLRRFASSDFIPPYWFRQRYNVCSLISKLCNTWPIVLPRRAWCLPHAAC